MSELATDLRTLRFWRWFATSVFLFIGVVASLAQLAQLAAPKLLERYGGWVIVASAIGSLAFGLWRAWPRPIECTYSQPATKISVVKGDLFEQGDAHIVVGVTTTFDTSVPNVISKASVLGQYIDRVYGGDVERLDQDIAAALSNDSPTSQVVKPGKTSAYALGSVATITQGNHKNYLLAYAEMSTANEARATIDGVWASLGSLWKEVSRTSNGGTVCVGLLGGAFARISHVLPAQDSLRLIVLSYIFASRIGRITDELRLVVKESDFQKLDRLELQAFLSSLKGS